ncbi:MAG: 4Fe-4S ferredoxin, partial [Desulfobacterales bacterium]|nr:4Fe-4S ferredoxin [Desulfobacterales bacterium]
MELGVDVYRKLQKHIDNMPIAFPESDSGLDIKLLKYMFTPEEAEIVLELSALPEPLERIHKRLKKTGISIGNLAKILDNLSEKGSIL